MKARRTAYSIPLTREERRGLRVAGPFRVTSHADGTLAIKADWSGCIPKDCKDGLDANNVCPACECSHIGGVFDRMAVAEIIQGLLNSGRDQ